MPLLQLNDVPDEVYAELQKRAVAHHRTLEAEAVSLLHHVLLKQPSSRSQAELLAELRRRSFTPPPGTPDSVALLAEDRGR
jgi:plasmid stability protein